MMKVNRRNFLGGMVAAAATPRIATSQTTTSSFPSQIQGNWMDRGLVDTGGLHEPYIFLVRRGGHRLDVKETCEYQQSEELIRELHRQGVEVFHTHLYKGFGMEAEQGEMEQTRKAVAFAHSLGMRADTYIQWNSMMYEAFFCEEPAAADWIQRDVAGLPILLPYGYEQSFRYCPCFSNQKYLDYLKKVVRYAVVDVKTDFIHFDNFGLNAEPDSCHCPACVTGFRNRLKTKYTQAQLKERFGFSRVDYINPPQWNNDNPPSKMQIISDPAFQEWIDYRCQEMADALKQMYDLIHSLNAEVALEINSGGITGQNHPWIAGTDHARLLPYTRSFWSEEGNDPELHEDGRLITRVRSYKLARAYSNVLITYVENNALALGESLAFNQTIGYLGSGPLSDITKTYLQFYLSNRESYEGAASAANVAVFRPYASLTYNNAQVQLCTMLTEQTLIQKSIPFDLIFDASLLQLEQYNVLILPNSECLSDQQLVRLKAYVAAGGSLLLIGNVAAYDEWRRVRTRPGFHEVVDYPVYSTSPEGGAQMGAVAPASVQRKRVGRGRVAYLPTLEFDGPPPPPRANFSILNEFWRLPKNWADFVALVTWATNDSIPLSIRGPIGVIAETAEQRDRRRLFVHVLNYNVAAIPIQRDIQIWVKLPHELQVAKATVRVPGNSSELAVPAEAGHGGISVKLPELAAYALLTIHW
jgi:hypothetical protein